MILKRTGFKQLFPLCIKGGKKNQYKMENKKSVVTAIAENTKQWAGPNGMVHYHTITFANGDSGQYGSKSPTCEKFKVNQETEYQHEVKQNGQYTNVVIKPVEATGGGFKGGPPKDASLIAAQSCLGYACNLHSQSSKSTDIDYVLSVAQKFHEWVMTKKTA